MNTLSALMALVARNEFYHKQMLDYYRLGFYLYDIIEDKGLRGMAIYTVHLIDIISRCDMDYIGFSMILLCAVCTMQRGYSARQNARRACDRGMRGR